MKKFRVVSISLAIAVLNLVSMSGCSQNTNRPALGMVSGKITLNGTPLKEATVEFQPAEGRPSIGVTDDQGAYRLSYTDTEKGAVIGQHSVRITTIRPQSGGEGGQPLVEARPEIVPANYNDNSTLTAEVKAGENVFDFPLEGERKK